MLGFGNYEEAGRDSGPQVIYRSAPQQPITSPAQYLDGTSNALAAPVGNPVANPYGSVTGPQSGNVFQQSQAALSGGMQGLSNAANPLAPMLSMNMYLNPYRDMVVADALSRQRDDMNMSLNQVRGQAAQSSAFGGARQGLVEAELMDRGNRNAGELAARMMQQGFDTSAGLGLQALAQNRIASQALGSMAPMAFNLGQNATSMQAAAGGQQQAMNQAILGGGVDTYNQYRNYPIQSLSTALAGVQGNPLQAAGTQTQTQQFNPGMLNYLQFGAGLLGGK